MKTEVDTKSMQADLPTVTLPVATVPIVTIDGPSGAGKGTIARLVAQKTGYELLDSGALYRLTALAASSANVGIKSESAVERVALTLDVQFKIINSAVQILLAGQDVTQAIREEQVGMNASVVAAYPSVRLALLQRQRDFATTKGLVADGRDMGTVVFPDAKVKIFLTASAEERANRRVKQLQQAGKQANYTTIYEDIKARDERDSSRAAAPLKPAEDAIHIDSTSVTIEGVYERIMQAVSSAYG